MSRLSVSARAEVIAYREPFHITGHTFCAAQVVVVTIGDGTVSGRGECSGSYYRGETQESMLAEIEAVRPAVEAGISRDELRKLMATGGARNALDCALWDLEAKRERRPVWQLAGLEPPRPLLTTYTLGAELPQLMADTAKKILTFTALKLKLTGEPELDTARVDAVRKARPDAWIGVDANQGYSVEKLPQLFPCLTRARVSLLEQPLARGRESDLDGVRCPVPIAADESVLDLSELPAAVGRFNVINIKLDKCGGLTEGLLMVAEARRLGMRVMVGNMGGSSWSMAPGWLVGQSCDVVDLDGPLFLVADRVPGASYDAGQIRCDDSVWGSPGA
ncbi:MAG: dipeptide epimerase [Gammaproteobacteria bacterium]